VDLNTAIGYHRESDLLLRENDGTFSLEVSFLFLLLACFQLVAYPVGRVIFSFIGPAPLGGERRGVGAAREWFQCLFSYFPGIQFTVRHVIVQGWPWNTLVATQLSVAAPRADGSMYQNEAMQFLHLRWGKVVEDRLYEDTYKLASELQQRLSRKETVVQD
jgi:ketosteroid isomerase-like protein